MNERRTERQRAEETNEQEALIGERSFLPLWDRRVGEGKREEGIKINERRQGVAPTGCCYFETRTTRAYVIRSVVIGSSPLEIK